jgi:hypothetical protein
MNKFLTYSLALLFAGTMASCSKSDPPLPDNTINFTADKQGIDAATTEVEVKLTLSRTTDVAVPLTVTLVSTGVVYGTDFTTDPVALNNSLTVTIAAGGSSATFKVKKVAGAVLNGTEKVAFTLTTAGSSVVLGSTVKAEISFAAITSDGSTLTLNGITAANEVGANAGNVVYVDFSGNTQVPVARDSWDLGFYSGADFKVTINSTLGASALLTTKTDIATVTAADFNPELLKVGQGAGTFAVIDDGREPNILNKTAIASISATDADNKVYIINRAGGSGNVAATADLYKVRILRKGSTGYTLQYAKVTETTFKTLEITKDATFNFQFASLVTGTAKSVEPIATKWDITWGYSLYWTAIYPYGFYDLVFINNLAGVTAAEVLTATVSYAAYAEANITATTFLTKRDVIGSNWRSTSPATGVKTDRFYVIKDGSGNVYKLKFVSMGAGDGGVRGKPVVEYKLVKKN